jgi:hypothetical protein
MLAIHVNPVGDADNHPMRLEDSSDPAFLALVEQCRNSGECSDREAREVANQLAREEGDDIRLAHVLRFRQAFPPNIQAQLLLEAWENARHPSRFDSKAIIAAFRELGALAFQFSPPESPARVFRVVGPSGAVRGMSWSLDQDKLHIFITRSFMKQEGSVTVRPARVYSAIATPESVVATFDFEDEIVVDPTRLSDVKLFRLVESKPK